LFVSLQADEIRHIQQSIREKNFDTAVWSFFFWMNWRFFFVISCCMVLIVEGSIVFFSAVLTEIDCASEQFQADVVFDRLSHASV
jgi:hypothetical protein